MPGSKVKSDVIVFETHLPYEQQLVVDELKRARIPAYARLCNSAGMEFAMPATGVLGFNAVFVVKTPARAAGAARKFIKTLPLADKSVALRPWKPAGLTENEWRNGTRFILAFVALCGVIQLLMLISDLRN